MSDDILKRAKASQTRIEGINAVGGCICDGCDLDEILPELVAEYERLRSSMIEIDGHRKIIELQDELARLQKIVIEATAWAKFNEEKLGCRQDVSFSDVATKYREQAARELGIDIAGSASKTKPEVIVYHT